MDHEFADAMRRLSVADDGPTALSRRQFLVRAMAATGGLTAAGMLGRMGTAHAQAVEGAPAPPEAVNPGSPSPTAPELVTPTELLPTEPQTASVIGEAVLPPGQLLIIQLGGGNDGLNTLVPMAGALGTDYRAYRGQVAITNPIALNDPLSGAATGFGLHPNLPYLAQLYAQGQVSIVRGVGYAGSTLSHFDTTATWMAGTAAGGPPTTGWLGRWLDTFPTPGPFDAIQIGSSIPLHLVGATRKASSLPSHEPYFGTSGDASDQLAYRQLAAASSAPSSRGPLADRMNAAFAGAMRINSTALPLYSQPAPLGSSDLVGGLKLAARLFNANLGVRIVSAQQHDYDQHDEELGTHADRLSVLNAALAAFFAELSPAQASRTTVMTFSEFGRKPWANASRGTDHGKASCLFVIGPGAAGGMVGVHPSLTGLGQWDDMEATTDFRQVYASILQTWLGANPTSILGGAYNPVPIFRSGPL